MEFTALSVVQGEGGGEGPGLNHLLRLEFARKLGRDGGVYGRLEWGRGAGVGSAWPDGVNHTVYTGGAATLVELAFSQTFFRERLCLKAGLLDVSGLADQNEVAGDETLRFLSPVFVLSPVISFPAAASPGLEARLAVSRRLSLGVLAVESGGLESGGAARIFAGVELGWRVFGRGRPGNYRVLAWQATGVRTPAAVEDGEDDGRLHRGLGISLDQYLIPWVQVFFRGGLRRVDGDTETFLSLGGRVSGRVWRRPNDDAGLAFGGMLCEGCHRDRSHDRVWPGTLRAELFYGAALGSHWHLCPGIQWTHDRRLDEPSRSAWWFHLRLRSSF